MAAYRIRRFLQMILVVLLSTTAIYALLNAAPGGPLSGINLTVGRPGSQVSELDRQRLEAYMGIDKPLVLRYVSWLLGDDWLGADRVSLSWGGHCPDTRHCCRFWAYPGVAHVKPGYGQWVRRRSPHPPGVGGRGKKEEAWQSQSWSTKRY